MCSSTAEHEIIVGVERGDIYRQRNELYRFCSSPRVKIMDVAVEFVLRRLLTKLMNRVKNKW
jgi:hypothetical protein